MAKGLGRGLGALISDTSEINNSSTKSGITSININKIEPNKKQPRQYFDETLLKELSESISVHGVIQPIILKNEGDFYSIIAGERRWRASKLAGLKEIPAIIKDYSDSEILQIALIENIQRSDLNPIEEALCYKRLIDEFFFTQSDISEKISKSTATVNSHLSLLKLDERVQTLMVQNRLSHSFGKILLKVTDLNDQYLIADMIAEDDMTLKSANALVEKYLKHGFDEIEKEKPKKSSDILQAEEELNKVFTANVKIKNNEKTNKGKIEIDYHSREELDRLILLFNRLK